MAEIAPDPPGWLTALRFDIDTDGGCAAWIEAELPAPNLVVVNPRNGHAHLVYLLGAWCRRILAILVASRSCVTRLRSSVRTAPRSAPTRPTRAVSTTIPSPTRTSRRSDATHRTRSTSSHVTSTSTNRHRRRTRQSESAATSRSSIGCAAGRTPRLPTGEW